MRIITSEWTEKGILVWQWYMMSVFSFKCSTKGKAFKANNEFYTVARATCQANKTWSISNLTDPCECKLELE